MSSKPELGRLESVDPRGVWVHEARDFTPWLLSNGDRLGESLGIDLEFERSEHPVGGFALDLIGRDLTNDAVLIVENQLGSTDHGHLGQVLTYAAGTGASTIVWITTGFREEHRQALEWLNEQTREDIRFFGVELRVVRIGESVPAPLLDAVVKPNDWQKVVRGTARAQALGGKATYYERFWGRYIERVQREHPGWTNARRVGRESWMSQPSGVPGTFISVCFGAGGKLRHELYIDAGDAAQNEEVFEDLLSRRNVLEEAYGRRLDFQRLEGRRACRIADHGVGDVTDEGRHDEFINWFFDAGARLRRALAVAGL